MHALIASIIALIFTLSASVQAVLIAYEGFDITPGVGALFNASGATSSGWTNNWGAASNNVIAGGLTYTSGGALNTVGGAAQLTVANGGSFRGFTPYYATGTGTYWVSFVGQISSNTSYSGLSLFNTSNEMLFFGQTSSSNPDWSVRAFGTPAIIVTSNIERTEQVFVVTRVDFNVNADLDEVRVWMNPVVQEAEPDLESATIIITNINLAGTSRASAFGQIRLQQSANGDNGVFDEIRIGTTWESVVPITGGGPIEVDQPGFSSMSQSGGQIILSITNLSAAVPYDLLGTTNLLDSNSWTYVKTLLSETSTLVETNSAIEMLQFFQIKHTAD